MGKTIGRMPHWGSPFRGAYFLVLCAMASATAIPPSELFNRQAICPASYSSCSFASLPANFCCPTEQTCMALAGNTTLLCCPKGSDCAKIKTIGCDVSLQDAVRQPLSLVKTTALTSTLPRCGDRCCPFGYSCQEGECVKDRDQNTPPPPGTATTAKPTSAPTNSPSSPSGPVRSTPVAADPGAQPTDSADSAAAGSGEETNQSSGGPSGAVIGGVIGGVFAAIFLIVLITCVLFKRKKKVEDAPSLKLTRSSSSFGNIISNPIIVEGRAMRSDFNRGPANRSIDGSTLEGVAAMRKSLSSAGSDSTRTRNLTANGLRQSSVAFGYPGADVTGQANPYAMKDEDFSPAPRTPRQQTADREPSSVSINVFADPLTLTPESASNAPRGNQKRYSNMTTFTQLMDQADLGGVARGDPYVPFRPSTSRDESPVRRT